MLHSDNKFVYSVKGLFFGVLALTNMTMGEICIVSAVKNVYKATKHLVLNTIDPNVTASAIFMEGFFFAFLGIVTFVSGCYILCKEHQPLVQKLGKFIRRAFT